MPSKNQILEETRYLIGLRCERIRAGCSQRRKTSVPALDLMHDYERLGELLKALHGLESGENTPMKTAVRLNIIGND
jgi:hypothetical protein